MNDRLRDERGRVARQWAIVANASMGLLFCAIAAYPAVKAAVTDCGYDLFGRDAYRRCTLAQAWIWLHTKDSVDYRITMTVFSVPGTLGLVGAALVRGRK